MRNVKKNLINLGLISTFFLTFGIIPGFSQVPPSVKKYSVARLSPVPEKLEESKSPAMSLNGTWEFKQGDKRSPITVPSEWLMQGFEVPEGKSVVYSKKLKIPKNWANSVVKLRFDGVSSNAIVRVNNQKVVEHEGSFVPFEADITKALKNDGENLLEVEVKALTISDIIACTSQYATHTVGGILRKVTLFALPKLNVADFTAVTDFDKQFKDAQLILKTGLVNEGMDGSSVSLRYTLSDQGGKQVLQKSFPVKDVPKKNGEQVNIENTIAVKAPFQWDAEHPYLYQLTYELLVDGKVLQTNKQKIGFREIEIKGNLSL